MYQRKKQTTILLVNTGTPDSPRVKDVRKYIREFLMDKRVIDISFLKRFILVNFIIAPFRAPRSAKLYKRLWIEKRKKSLPPRHKDTKKHKNNYIIENGSPLLYYGKELVKLLQNILGEEYHVWLAMRYGNPGIGAVLDQIKNNVLGGNTQHHSALIVIPLFPQYAPATTGSVNEKVMEIIKTWQVTPEVRFINGFFDDTFFIKAFAEIGKRYMQEDEYDHIIFSYHGLPERQIKKADQSKCCLASNEGIASPPAHVPSQARNDNSIDNDCCAKIEYQNRHCYRAQCFETSRLLAKAIGINEEDYTVCFQSRLGKIPWIKPYTDKIVTQLPAKGGKKVLVFAPSFVADCLETIIEIGEEYRNLFYRSGGKKWQMVESLNTHPLWVETLKRLIIDCFFRDKKELSR